MVNTHAAAIQLSANCARPRRGSFYVRTRRAYRGTDLAPRFLRLARASTIFGSHDSSGFSRSLWRRFPTLWAVHITRRGRCMSSSKQRRTVGVSLCLFFRDDIRRFMQCCTQPTPICGSFVKNGRRQRFVQVRSRLHAGSLFQEHRPET